MKSKLMVSAFSAIMVFTAQSTAFAIGGEGRDSFDRNTSVKSEPEIVKWIGEVSDDESSHTTEHGHELRFTKKDDGKTYDVVDSPELVKLHHETEKNYLVEIEAEKTSRFLFWGGNLIVKNFKVLADASGVIPHHAPVRTHSGPRMGRGR